MRFLGCQIEDKIENQIRDRVENQIRGKVWEQVDDVWWGVWEARKDLRIQFQIINEPGFSRR